MSILFSRKAIIPVWLVVVFGLYALFGPTMTFAAFWPLLIVGIFPPAMVLLLFKEPSRSVAEMVRDIDAPRTD